MPKPIKLEALSQKSILGTARSLVARCDGRKLFSYNVKVLNYSVPPPIIGKKSLYFELARGLAPNVDVTENLEDAKLCRGDLISASGPRALLKWGDKGLLEARGPRTAEG